MTKQIYGIVDQMADYHTASMDRIRKFSDIMIYNLLFCLFSVPVITGGAALFALCDGMQRLVRDEDVPVFRTFLDAFKSNFKRSTILWLITIAGYVFLYSLQYSAVSLSNGHLATRHMATFYVMMFLLLFCFQHLFPTAVKWQELSPVGCIGRAYVITGNGFGWTLLGIISTSIFSYVTLAVNPFVIPFGLMLWIVCGFGIIAYIEAVCFLKAAANFERKQANQEELKDK